MSDRPAGLYLHVPFCSRICPYCDFAVRTGDAARRRRYVDHLLAEIELYADHALRFDTIYFGGGTPSLLDPQELGRILEALRRKLRFADRVWIFLEANPEDVSTASLRDWKSLGVTTLSLGVQSLEAAWLEFLGRRHGPDDARSTVEAALRTGFETVSIDLIYGLPGQTPEAWREEMARALELGAQHLSCYQLTIHERTRFRLLERRGRLLQLPEDEQAELFRLTHEFLNACGMQGYEASQFASEREHQSRHNTKYWDHTPYLGLGPSAHSYQERRRWWNLRRTDAWQDRLREGRRPIEDEESLGREALALEALMTGLRTYAGVDLERLRTRWNVDLIESNRDLVERLQADGLLSYRDERLVPSLDGLAIADSLATRFVTG